MIISGSILLNKLRFVVPSTFLFASTVPHGLVAASWSAVSSLLPNNAHSVLDDYMWGCYQKFVLFFFENCSGVKIYLYGDIKTQVEENVHENVLYLSNHQSAVDWIVSDMVALRLNRVGNMRFVLKDQLKWIPMFGWYFAVHGCVYVRRAGAFRVDIANKGLNYLALGAMPLFLVMFPEGTRFNADKHDVVRAAQEFARQKGILPLRNVLLPRKQGTLLVLQNLRSRLDCVLDATLIYSTTRKVSLIHNTVNPDERDVELDGDGGDGRRLDAPGMFDFMALPPGSAVHILIRRYPIDDVPSDPAELDTWLYDRFAEKDRFLNEFYKSGTVFDGYQGTASNLPLSATLPSFLLYALNVYGLAVIPKLRELFVPVFLALTFGGYGYLLAKQVA